MFTASAWPEDNSNPFADDFQASSPLSYPPPTAASSDPFGNMQQKSPTYGMGGPMGGPGGMGPYGAQQQKEPPKSALFSGLDPFGQH